VQENRFVMQVQAWGPAEERAVVDWRTIDGSPKTPTSWDLLLEAMDRKYLHASGLMLPIHATAIDSGYESDKVYDFVLAMEGIRRLYCTKGSSVDGKRGEPLVGKPSEKRRGKDSRPVRLYMLNADAGKRDVYGALSVVIPPGYTGRMPGTFHFPQLDVVDEEYFAQLMAEHAEPRKNKQGVVTHEVWVRDRVRNEALDTAILCLAGLRIWRPNILQMIESLRVAGQRVGREPSPGLPGSPLNPSRPPAATRRHSTSGYLKR
jgi:phage terminase large subunit GpA-like protein